MSFNWQLDPFPDSISFDGDVHAVNPSFKCILAILNLFNDASFSDVEKQMIAIRLFYNDKPPKDIRKAVDEMMRFIRCYDEEDEKKDSGETTFDFDVDSSGIYSAFFQVYRLDLDNIDLHWFKFVSLFENLNDGTPNIVNIMNIRQMKIEPNLSKERKAELVKLKRRFALKKSKEDALTASSNLANAFVKGGGKHGL